MLINFTNLILDEYFDDSRNYFTNYKTKGTNYYINVN
jgi:hypothetical protein